MSAAALGPGVQAGSSEPGGLGRLGSTAAPAAPALSKGLNPATAPKQLAVLWAEQYVVGADGAQTLLFLRLADAHSFRIIASELVLTHTGATPVVGTVAFRDERSFIPRLTQSGEWTFGFERDSHPVGSALLTHLCLTQSKLSVAGDPYVAIVAGGGPAGGVVGMVRTTSMMSAPKKTRLTAEPGFKAPWAMARTLTEALPRALNTLPAMPGMPGAASKSAWPTTCASRRRAWRWTSTAWWR